MEDTNVTAEEIEALLAGEIRKLATEMAAAMNGAKAGRIIADSEEPVRDAHGKFRQQAFEKVIGLLQAKQEAFSPSAQGISQQGPQAGDAPDGQRATDD
jgi:hypothetical protein